MSLSGIVHCTFSSSGLQNYGGPGVTVSFFPCQFFPRGKNGPACSFPGEKTDWGEFWPVTQGHCPMIAKYGPSLSKPVGPVYPSFLVVNKYHFDKYSSYSGSTNSTKQKVHLGSQYSKTCPK